MIILDSDPERRRELAHGLEGVLGYLPSAMADPAAMNGDASRAAALVLVRDDVGEQTLELLADLRARAPQAALLLLTAGPDLDQAREAVEAGAQDCLTLEGLSPEQLGRALLLAMERAGQRRKLQERAERYRAIVETQSELICRCGREGMVDFANQAYCRYFGLDLDQALGRPFLSSAFEDDRRFLWGQINTLDAEHPVSRAEARVSTPWDEERWLSFVIHASFGPEGELSGFQCVGLDITERKAVDEALQVAESNLRQIISSTADGMVVVDRDSKVLFVNPAAELLLGRRNFDMVGEPCSFPVEPGPPREMVFNAEAPDPVVAEIRVVETKWQRSAARLASLRDITELVNLREQLRSMSLVDDLTGLYNRRGFTTLARQQIKTANRMMRRMLLIFADLDGLKEINDNLGHHEGDRAIKETAMVLKATFRESDILSRFGGDEFVALAMLAHSEAIASVIERVRTNLRDWNKDASRPYNLSLSLGRAIYDPAKPRDLNELVSEADSDMYKEKHRRRDSRLPGDIVRDPKRC